MFQKISHFFSMVIVKTFMYRSHLDQISSSVDTSSAPCIRKYKIVIFFLPNTFRIWEEIFLPGWKFRCIFNSRLSVSTFSNCCKQTTEIINEIKNLKTKMRDEKVPDKKLTALRDGGGGTKRVLTKYLWQIQGLPSLLLVICIVCQNNHGYWKHLHFTQRQERSSLDLNWQGRNTVLLVCHAS